MCIFRWAPWFFRFQFFSKHPTPHSNLTVPLSVSVQSIYMGTYLFSTYKFWLRFSVFSCWVSICRFSATAYLLSLFWSIAIMRERSLTLSSRIWKLSMLCLFGFPPSLSHTPHCLTVVVRWGQYAGRWKLRQAFPTTSGDEVRAESECST